MSALSPQTVRQNARRRRLRRILAWCLLPVAIVAVAFSGKLLSMYAFAHQASTLYAAQNYAGSRDAARGQEFLNGFEAYKAPYNEGVALAGMGQLDQAQRQLEQALKLVPQAESCAVRVDLSLVQEMQGDKDRANQDQASAHERYQKALEIVAAAPAGCHRTAADAASPDRTRSMGGTLDDATKRLQDKLRQPPPDSSPQQQQSPPPDALQKLQQELEQGQRDRQQQMGGGGDQQDSGGSDGQDGSGGGSEVPKPW